MATNIFSTIKRIKTADAPKFLPGNPLIAEIQLRGLSGIMNYLNKPYDEKLHNCLVKTTEKILGFDGCIVGYVFGNEIAVVIYFSNTEHDPPFDGLKSDLISYFSSNATLQFAKQKNASSLPKEVKDYDCNFTANIYEVKETVAAIEWLMAKETKAKHLAAKKICKDLDIDTDGKNTKELIEALKQVDFDLESKPNYMHRGTFVKKRKLAEGGRSIEILDIPPVHQIFNKLGVFFGNEQAQLIKPNLESKKRR